MGMPEARVRFLCRLSIAFCAMSSGWAETRQERPTSITMASIIMAGTAIHATGVGAAACAPGLSVDVGRLLGMEHSA